MFIYNEHDRKIVSKIIEEIMTEISHNSFSVRPYYNWNETMKVITIENLERILNKVKGE